MIKSKMKFRGKDIFVCKIDNSESISALERKKSIHTNVEYVEDVMIKKFISSMICIQKQICEAIVDANTNVRVFKQYLNSFS